MQGVQNAEPEKFPDIAAKIRAFGQQLNSEFKTAYNNIDTMRADWYGQRYNDLIGSFNSLTQTINDMLTLVVTDVPFNLETVANNYSNWDKGSNACNAQQTPIEKIQSIGESTATGIRFIFASVSSTQAQVSANFDKAKGFMDSIDTVLKSIVWESDSAKVFKEKFATMKQNINESIAEIKDAFVKSISKTSEEMQAAEKANTLN